MNLTPTTEKETPEERGVAKRLEELLKEALPLEDVADTEGILDRDRRIEAILKRVASIGRAWRHKANSAGRARSLSARRLEGMRRALVLVEDYLVAFEPMGSERLGRRRSAVLKYELDAEEQRRDWHPGPLREVIGFDREGAILRSPGQVSPHLLERLREERKRRPMPPETIEDLEFFTEIQRLAETQASERSNNLSFLWELKELWHAVRGMRLTLDDALKTRSETVGRPKDVVRIYCASDILHKLEPICLGRRREWPFLRLALASAGFPVPDDPTDFMRAVRARTKKLVDAFPYRPNAQPVVEPAARAHRFAAWSHPEFFKRPETKDKLLEAALKPNPATRKKAPRIR